MSACDYSNNAPILSAKSRRRSLNGRLGGTTVGNLAISPGDLATLSLQWPTRDEFHAEDVQQGQDSVIVDTLRQLITSASDYADGRNILRSFLTLDFNATAEALSSDRLSGVLVAADAPLLAARFLLPLARTGQERCPVVLVRRLRQTSGLHVLGLLRDPLQQQQEEKRDVMVELWRGLVEVTAGSGVAFRLPGENRVSKGCQAMDELDNSGLSVELDQVEGVDVDLEMSQETTPNNDDDDEGDSVGVEQDEDRGEISDLEEKEGCLEDESSGRTGGCGEFIGADFISISGDTKSSKRPRTSKNPLMSKMKKQRHPNLNPAKLSKKTSGGIFLDTRGRTARNSPRF